MGLSVRKFEGRDSGLLRRRNSHTTSSTAVLAITVILSRPLGWVFGNGAYVSVISVWAGKVEFGR